MTKNIEEFIDNLTESEMVYHHNEMCYAYNYYDHAVMNSEEAYEYVLRTCHDLSDLICECGGLYHYNEWWSIDGYGHIKEFDTADCFYIFDEEEIAEYFERQLA